jgi:hypothetical protein
MAKPGGTAARGYGARHQAERKRWAALVKAGQATCCLCFNPIPPDAPWDLDHTPDRTAYRGVACQSCNRSDGASRGNRMRGRQGPPPRRWIL